MKNNYLKMLKHVLTTLAIFAGTVSGFAQDINYTFANAQKTTDGAKTYYEVDVLISTTTDFKLGSGQLYFTYNTAAFGPNIKANNKLTYSQPAGYILGEVYFFPAYTSFITNDNTDFRVSVSYQQGLSSGTISSNNVISTPKKLFHLKVEFIDPSQDPMFKFETGSVYLDQTYTACGPNTMGPPDCTNFPGIQLFNDTFNSSEATLGVKDNGHNLEVSVYPNPTKSYVTIKTPADTQLKFSELYNSVGQKLKTYDQDTFSIANLANGTYMIKITTSKGVTTKKIIKTD